MDTFRLMKLQKVAYQIDSSLSSITFYKGKHVELSLNSYINTAALYIPEAKVHTRTDYEGPYGEKRYSSTLSLTSALGGGGWSTPRPGRYTPGKDPVPFV